MKKLLVILALAVLLVPGIVLAQPAGCNWSGGDPALVFGFGGNAWDVVGTNYAYLLPGMTYYSFLGGKAMNVNGTWNYFLSCCYSATDTDTFCYYATSKRGWDIYTYPDGEIGKAYIKAPGKYVEPFAGWYGPDFYVDVPSDAPIGTKDTIVIGLAYHNVGTCAPECGDCEDPNYSPTYDLTLASWDKLVIEVIASPMTIEQDSLTLVDRGQTEAYIPFDIRNWSSDDGMNYYTISNTGTVGGPASKYDSVLVAAEDRETVYLAINAGAADVCDYDELTIIAWRFFDSVMYYDTCVQLIHVIEPREVPLFTVPVVTILVLALILAAAVFMRRRAVSKA